MATQILKAGTTILGAFAFIVYYSFLIMLGSWTSYFRKAARPVHE